MRIEIAELTVHPAERALAGPAGTVSVEPLVMALLLALAERAGQLVPRRALFEALWASPAVGDDNLNRLVAVLRRRLGDVGAESIEIATVPAQGYSLRLRPSAAQAPEATRAQALGQALDSWRLALPQPDPVAIALIERAAAAVPGDAALWGWLAMLYRHAAEYAAPTEADDHVLACERASGQALAIDSGQVEAATALVSVAPLYGRWSDSARRLGVLCDANPAHPVPHNDLAVLEMATGQVRAAIERRRPLIARDPLAALHGYKTVYQNWSFGDLTTMDHAADAAVQLHPRHPAAWLARFWTFAFTARAAAALAMLDGPVRPAFAPPMLAYLRDAVGAAIEPGDDGRERAVERARAFAAAGPSPAIQAMFGLSLLGRIDDLFAVAWAYYLRDGDRPVPLQVAGEQPRLNEQHGRLTQILFTPVFAGVRDDPRFGDLCERIGLSDYWDEAGVTPDYLARRGAGPSPAP
ncbi:helix-turn-helix domain-containing protein [Sphingomonas sp. ASV193]|uniref:helix-turn-helix domain-containing protein n=1 Tax=Sphingomonas sp. ASV193 TaxID=3144405 RepID=UPI0032E86046